MCRHIEDAEIVILIFEQNILLVPPAHRFTSDFDFLKPVALEVAQENDPITARGWLVISVAKSWRGSKGAAKSHSLKNLAYSHSRIVLQIKYPEGLLVIQLLAQALS